MKRMMWPLHAPLLVAGSNARASGGAVAATIDVVSGANNTYNTQTTNVAYPPGTHKVYLVFRANPAVAGKPAANLFSLNWFEVVGTGVGTP